MAHESFGDEATAALMNELYVNIKVDREGRPELRKVQFTPAPFITPTGATDCATRSASGPLPELPDSTVR